MGPGCMQLISMTEMTMVRGFTQTVRPHSADACRLIRDGLRSRARALGPVSFKLCMCYRRPTIVTKRRLKRSHRGYLKVAKLPFSHNKARIRTTLRGGICPNCLRPR